MKSAELLGKLTEIDVGLDGAMNLVVGADTEAPPSAPATPETSTSASALESSKPEINSIIIAGTEFSLSEIAKNLEKLKERDWCKKLISRLDAGKLDELEFKVLSILVSDPDENAALDHILSTIDARRDELSKPSPPEETNPPHGEVGSIKPTETESKPFTKTPERQKALEFLSQLIEHYSADLGTEINDKLITLQNATDTASAQATFAEIKKIFDNAKKVIPDPIKQGLFKS